MEGQSGKTCDDEEAEQTDFGDGEKIAELVAARDAAIVHGCKEANENC